VWLFTRPGYSGAGFSGIHNNAFNDGTEKTFGIALAKPLAFRIEVLTQDR